METIGIRTTIYDFFAYLMSGVICYVCIALAMYFTGYSFFIPLKNIFGKELLSALPNWSLLVLFVFVGYVSGLLLSTLSSLVIEKLLMKIPLLLKQVEINKMLSENIYNLFMYKFFCEFACTFNKNDIRLILSLVENKSTNSYRTAFSFLTLYGLYRNICMMFFVIGVTTFIFNMRQCVFPVFGIVLILFSIISFIGYIRFYKYFHFHIVSAYVNIK